MPSHARVQELISYVEQGRFLDALREFYHEEAAMQENSEAPRLGLTACLDQEARFLEAVQTFHEIRASSFVVDGDRAAIQWVFALTLKNGAQVHREEIAYQRWENEKILWERFFYDAATPAPSDTRVTSPPEQGWASLGIVCAVVGDRGQITLPAALFRQHTLRPGLRPGDRLLVTDAPLGLGILVSETLAAGR